MEYGVDIASHQGYPNWPGLARGHSYMFTKATGEGNYVNPYWRDNHDAARAAGLVPGTYDWYEPQFCNATDWTGEDAAADYLRVIGSRISGSLVAVDYESPDWDTGYYGRAIEEPTRRYLYTLKERANKPIIVYAGDYFLRETGAIDWGWLGRDFLLWRAAPGDGMIDDAAQWYDGPVSPFPVVTIHQHQWHATGPYVAGEYDRNRTNLTREQIAALANGYTMGADVKEPQPGEFSAYVNDAGNTIFVANFGGATVPGGILGYPVVDLGVTVRSAHDPNGTQESRSVQGNKMGDWRESPIPKG